MATFPIRGVPGQNVSMSGQDDKFYLGRRLGSGSFGQVFLAKNRRGKELAVKVENLGSGRVGRCFLKTMWGVP